MNLSFTLLQPYDTTPRILNRRCYPGADLSVPRLEPSARSPHRHI